MERVTRRNGAVHTWRQLLRATAAGAAADLHAGARDGLDLFEAPYLMLRAFLRSTTASASVDGAAAAIDLHYWFAGMAKGALAASVALTAGAETSPTAPEGGGGAWLWNEVDVFQRTAGWCQPSVRNNPDAQAVLYLPTHEALSLRLRCASIDANRELIVLGKPAWDLPPAGEVAFFGHFASATGTEQGFTARQGAPNAAPGSGREHVIDQVEIVASGASVVSIVGGASGTVVFGAVTLSAGYIVIPGPIFCGENKAPLVTVATAAAQVQIRGRTRPFER